MRVELSIIASRISRMALGIATAFFLLPLAAVLFMKPAPTERAILLVVLALNALVIAGSLGLRRFMLKSDNKLSDSRKQAEKETRKGPTIDDWLKNH